jgi:hypothetical protein
MQDCPAHSDTPIVDAHLSLEAINHQQQIVSPSGAALLLD